MWKGATLVAGKIAACEDACNGSIGRVFGSALRNTSPDPSDPADPASG